MLNKILSVLTIMGLIIAIVIGIYFRQSYTNITAEANFLEKHFNIAVLENDVYPELAQDMKKELPNSNMIIRAKSLGSHFKFKCYLQYVEVLDVYKGEELKKGDKIAVGYEERWTLYYENMQANLNYINLMQPGEDYLIFLDRKLENPFENNIYLVKDFLVPPIFNYQDKENVIISNVPEDNLIPYEKVKNNEFFVSSNETLQSLMETKHELLKKYSK